MSLKTYCERIVLKGLLRYHCNTVPSLGIGKFSKRLDLIFLVRLFKVDGIGSDSVSSTKEGINFVSVLSFYQR